MGRCDGLGWDMGLGLAVSGERNMGRCLGWGVRAEGVEEERKKKMKREKSTGGLDQRDGSAEGVDRSQVGEIGEVGEERKIRGKNGEVKV